MEKMTSNWQQTITFNEFMMDALTGLLNTHQWQEERDFKIEYAPAGATREHLLELLPDHNLYNILVVRAIINRNKSPLTKGEIDEVLGDWVDDYIAERDEEDEKDEQVYQVIEGVDDYVGNHEELKQFKTYSTEDGKYQTTYYETFGGGPQGGYFVRTFYPIEGEWKDEVYSVHRTWGNPFTATKLPGTLKYNEDGDGTAGTLRYSGKKA